MLKQIRKHSFNKQVQNLRLFGQKNIEILKRFGFEHFEYEYTG